LPKILLYYFLFLLIAALSLITALDRSNFLITFSQLVLYALFYWAVVNTVTTKKQANRILKIILISGIISASIGITQYIVAVVMGPQYVTDIFYNRLGLWIFGIRGLERIGDANRLGFFFRSDLPGIGSAFRAFGFFGGGNSFGFYHALIYALLLPLVVWRKNRRWFLGVAGLVILATAVFLSWSRMAWLMLFLSTIYCLQPGRANILKLVIGVTVGMILVLFLAFLLPDLALSQAIIATVTRSDTSTISRIQSMSNSLSIWQDHPWLGGGLGNYPMLASDIIEGRVSTITAENLYLELLAEVGLLGFGVFMFLLIKIGLESQILLKHRAPQTRRLGRAFRSFWLASLMGFTFNAILTEPRTMLMWWLVVGLMTVNKRLVQAEYRTIPPMTAPQPNSSMATPEHRIGNLS
jgi:O-antigen ligase